MTSLDGLCGHISLRPESTMRPSVACIATRRVMRTHPWPSARRRPAPRCAACCTAVRGPGGRGRAAPQLRPVRGPRAGAAARDRLRAPGPHDARIAPATMGGGVRAVLSYKARRPFFWDRRGMHPGLWNCTRRLRRMRCQRPDWTHRGGFQSQQAFYIDRRDPAWCLQCGQIG